MFRHEIEIPNLEEKLKIVGRPNRFPRISHKQLV